MPKETERMSLADVNDLRAQVAAGEDVSDEQLASAVDACRAGRFSAESSAKKKSQPVSLFDLKMPGEGEKDA